jgi:hypothetical protein
MHECAREERKSFRILRSRTFVSSTLGSLASSSGVNMNVFRISSAFFPGATSAKNFLNGFDDGLPLAIIVTLSVRPGHLNSIAKFFKVQARCPSWTSG